MLGQNHSDVGAVAGLVSQKFVDIPPLFERVFLDGLEMGLLWRE